MMKQQLMWLVTPGNMLRIRCCVDVEDQELSGPWLVLDFIIYYIKSWKVLDVFKSTNGVVSMKILFFSPLFHEVYHVQNINSVNHENIFKDGKTLKITSLSVFTLHIHSHTHTHVTAIIISIIALIPPQILHTLNCYHSSPLLHTYITHHTHTCLECNAV